MLEPTCFVIFHSLLKTHRLTRFNISFQCFNNSCRIDYDQQAYFKQGIVTKVFYMCVHQVKIMQKVVKQMPDAVPHVMDKRVWTNISQWY